MTADAAVGRPQADDAVGRRRRDDRAARLGADREADEPGRRRRSRAGRRSASTRGSRGSTGSSSARGTSGRPAPARPSTAWRRAPRRRRAAARRRWRRSRRPGSDTGAAPHVVRMPLVANRSLAPHGMPCSGPRYVRRLISLSACAACASASSSVSVTTQFSRGPCFFSRSRYIRVSSVDETSRRWTSGASAVTGRNARSSTDERRACGAAARP